MDNSTSEAEAKPAIALYDFAQPTGFKRLTFIAKDGVIEKLFYPVFPPDQNATDVIAWLQAANT